MQYLDDCRAHEKMYSFTNSNFEVLFLFLDDIMSDDILLNLYGVVKLTK
jgi:hypothetical protein